MRKINRERFKWAPQSASSIATVVSTVTNAIAILFVTGDSRTTAITSVLSLAAIIGLTTILGFGVVYGMLVAEERKGISWWDKHTVPICSHMRVLFGIAAVFVPPIMMYWSNQYFQPVCWWVVWCVIASLSDLHVIAVKWCVDRSEGKLPPQRPYWHEGSYIASRSGLTSIDQLPIEIVHGDLWITNNNIKSFHNIHHHIKVINGMIVCDRAADMLGLVMINGVKGVQVLGDDQLTHLFDKHFDDPIALQDAMLDGGYVDEARL